MTWVVILPFLCVSIGLSSVSHLRLLFCFYGDVDLEVGLGGGGGLALYKYIYMYKPLKDTLKI